MTHRLGKRPWHAGGAGCLCAWWHTAGHDAEKNTTDGCLHLCERDVLPFELEIDHDNVRYRRAALRDEPRRLWFAERKGEVRRHQQPSVNKQNHAVNPPREHDWLTQIAERS